MARLIAAFIRHGEYHQLDGTPSAHQPFQLTAEGEEHARKAERVLRETIARHGWSICPIIDSSRMLRAWQTARIVTERLDNIGSSTVLIESFDELAERGVGSVANLTIKQIEAVLRQDPRFDDPPDNWKADSYYKLPFQGAESLMDAGERVAAHLTRRMTALADEHLGRDTLKLFVGHGASFRHAAYHLGILEFEQIEKLSMYHGRPLFIEYLSENQWRHIEGEWKIRGDKNEAMD